MHITFSFFVINQKKNQKTNQKKQKKSKNPTFDYEKTWFFAGLQRVGFFFKPKKTK